MDGLAQAIKNLATMASELSEPAGDDFIVGGLRHCGKCQKPKQARIEAFEGEILIVPCVCDCRKAELAAERARLEEEQRKLDKAANVKRLRMNGIQDRLLLQHTFDTVEQTELIKKCKKYAEHWQEMRDDNIGLMIWGAVGGGKSLAAACIANELIDNEIPVMLTSFPRILEALRDSKRDADAYLDALNEYELLILDDFGAERDTEYATEKMFEIVDMRYKSQKPLIITTNFAPKELQGTAEISKKRIYSRLNEMCVPLKCEAGSWRQRSTIHKIKTAKELMA